MKAMDIEKRVHEILNDNHIMGEVEVIECHDCFRIKVYISWGDWKHDHLRLRWNILNKFNIGHWFEEATETDGSDCYCATHTYEIEKEVKEPLVLELQEV